MYHDKIRIGQFVQIWSNKEMGSTLSALNLSLYRDKLWDKPKLIGWRSWPARPIMSSVNWLLTPLINSITALLWTHSIFCKTKITPTVIQMKKQAAQEFLSQKEFHSNEKNNWPVCPWLHFQAWNQQQLMFHHHSVCAKTYVDLCWVCFPANMLLLSELLMYSQTSKKPSASLSIVSTKYQLDFNLKHSYVSIIWHKGQA